MDSFTTKLNLIKKTKLKEFLYNLNKPCFETKLLKVAFDNKNIMNSDALTLYQNHFILFHVLYKMQDEFYREGKYLFVHFARTNLIDYPAKNFCHYYYEDTGVFCNSKTKDDKEYCRQHSKLIDDNFVETLSIKYFYLDEENYNKLDKKNAEAFINGAWELLGNYKKYEESLKILDLPTSASLELIKKQFKKLAKQHHPDLGANDHNKFNEINRAYRYILKMYNFIEKK